MLTAREPSVKPLADVVRCYICCDGQHKSGNTRHFSHLPSRINGRARPQTHYTTRFAKKIQEMPRAGLSYRGKAPSSYNLSVSLRSTAPLVGEPLAKPFTLRGLPRPPLGRGGGSASALTERLSPAAAHGQALLRPTSQSGLRPPTPLVGEPLAKRRSFPVCQGLPSVGATATTAASGGNREELLGQWPAGCERQRSKRWEPQPGQCHRR